MGNCPWAYTVEKECRSFAKRHRRRRPIDVAPVTRESEPAGTKAGPDRTKENEPTRLDADHESLLGVPETDGTGVVASLSRLTALANELPVHHLTRPTGVVGLVRNLSQVADHGLAPN